MDSSRDLIWYFSFLARTFDFHAGLLFLTLGVLALWAHRPGVASAALPLCVIGLAPTLGSYSLQHPAGQPQPGFRVMTVNLLWVNRQTGPIIEEIRAENPDLLLLQEYTPTWHLAVQGSLAKAFPYSFCYPADEAFGAAIYSKYPLADSLRCPGAEPGDRSPFLRTVTLVGGKEVAVYCVHIVPPSWFNRKLMPRQFCALYNSLKQEQRPIIAGGDFNFTTHSTMHEKLQSLGLVDAQSESGRGRGATFKIRWLPDIAIDHVYFSPPLVSTQCRTGVGHGADHRPVAVDFLTR